MDIEHLNKTQIVLLTLLVSFVTSIATGIATVSLIEKAPADVTRIIDRIVEQPIETIISGKDTVVTQTVVVQESDLIAQSIETLRPSLVRIYQEDRVNRVFVAFGIISDAQGTIMTNATVVKARKEYVVMLSDGTTLRATAGPAVGSIISLSLDVGQDVTIPPLVSATQASVADLKLGQTAVALGSSGEALSIAPGIISEITSTEADTEGRGLVRTTITSTNIVPGSPLITTQGKVIGIAFPTEPGLFRSIAPVGMGQ